MIQREKRLKALQPPGYLVRKSELQRASNQERLLRGHMPHPRCGYCKLQAQPFRIGDGVRSPLGQLAAEYQFGAGFIMRERTLPTPVQYGGSLPPILEGELTRWVEKSLLA